MKPTRGEPQTYKSWQMSTTLLTDFQCKETLPRKDDEIEESQLQKMKHYLQLQLAENYEQFTDDKRERERRRSMNSRT
eukprot:4309237-Amphidinium_carterae.1